MHAQDAKQLARMDGTALKAYLALLGAGREGLSSDECAAAIEYGIRHVQIALRSLVDTGLAQLVRAGRLVRYVATGPGTQSQDTTRPEKTSGAHSQEPTKVTRVNVMLSGPNGTTMPESHSTDSGESSRVSRSGKSDSRQATPPALKIATGAQQCANRSPNFGGMKSSQDTRSPLRPDTGNAHASAPIADDQRTGVRPSTRPAQPTAPIAASAQPSAPIPGFSPAPPLPKDRKTLPQQQHTEIGKPPRVVVVGEFAGDLERPGYLAALRLAIGSKRNPMTEREFSQAVQTFGLDYCNRQYKTLLETYERPDRITGRLWLAAIRNDYVGSNAARTKRLLEIGKKLDQRTQAQQTAIRRAVAENDAANEAAANEEREELRATLQRMSEDQLAALLDEVGATPHHRPRNAVAHAKRTGARAIDVLTRPTVAPYTRDVLAERQRAAGDQASHSAA